MNPHPTSPRGIDALGAGACLALVGAAYLTGFGPLLRERSERESQRTALTERQHKVSALQDSLLLLAERRRIYDAELTTHPVRLLPASDVLSRLAAIVRLAGECGLNVPDIAPQAPRTDQRFTIVPIVLRGTGGYPTAAAFFDGLNREFRDTAVTAFTLTAPDPTDQGADAEWSANSVGPPPAPRPARAEFTFELAWFAAPSDRAAAGGK